MLTKTKAQLPFIIHYARCHLKILIVIRIMHLSSVSFINYGWQAEIPWSFIVHTSNWNESKWMNVESSLNFASIDYWLLYNIFISFEPAMKWCGSVVSVTQYAFKFNGTIFKFDENHKHISHTDRNLQYIFNKRTILFEYSAFSILKWYSMNGFSIWVMWVLSRLQSSMNFKRIKTSNQSLKELHSIYGSLRMSLVWWNMIACCSMLYIFLCEFK